MYVVITGASRGIGRALAYTYASHKYNLILTCEKNFALLEQIKKELIDLYNIKVIIKSGLIVEDDIKNINDDIYILINNAGKCQYDLCQDITYEKYKEIIYANLDYTFLTTKLIINKMKKNHFGVIINISSMWGIYGASNESIYAMTKGGINAFTKSLAKELEPIGVDVVAYAIGAVDTEMNNHLSFEEKKDFESTLTNKRMFTPNEIANTIYDETLKHAYKSGDIIELNNGLR